ncbi:hypothetical protein KY328_04985 [Candidatus Woesearchaeota archaeon]|nr:hypothetical protein [Candidatus Woesearchaeota archaeon]MBW3022253.1 hypothetical protein [Candidatus Woesearchaeota archaeon]
MSNFIERLARLLEAYHSTSLDRDIDEQCSLKKEHLAQEYEESDILSAGTRLETIMQGFERPKVAVIGPGQLGPDASVFYFALKHQQTIDLTIVDPFKDHLRSCKEWIDDFLNLNSFIREPRYVQGSAFSLNLAIEEQDLIFYHDMMSMFFDREYMEEVIAATRTSLSEDGKAAFVFIEFKGPEPKDAFVEFNKAGYRAMREILEKQNLKHEEHKIVNDYPVKSRLAIPRHVYYRGGAFRPQRRCNRMIVFGK